MGGEMLTQSPLRGTNMDAGQAPKKVAGGDEECGEGRDNGGGRDNGEQGFYEVYGIDDAYGGGQLREGGGPGL